MSTVHTRYVFMKKIFSGYSSYLELWFCHSNGMHKTANFAADSAAGLVSASCCGHYRNSPKHWDR